VKFQGRWIFPIICESFPLFSASRAWVWFLTYTAVGVWLAFSLVFVPLAFNATLFKNLFFRKPKEGKSSDYESRGRYESPRKSVSDKSSQGLRYRGRVSKKSTDLEIERRKLEKSMGVP
jgi:hypothetical protein